MDNETTETDDPWWFNASCALVGCTCEHHDRCSDWLEKREIDHA
jgi:hypothetical protein